METFLIFNEVKILLTTGQRLSEVQNCLDQEPDLILSIYPQNFEVLLHNKREEKK